MFGFKNFSRARFLIAGIEALRMMCKNQPAELKDQATVAANEFYLLAFYCSHRAPTCLGSCLYRDRNRGRRARIAWMSVTGVSTRTVVQNAALLCAESAETGNSFTRSRPTCSLVVVMRRSATTHRHYLQNVFGSSSVITAC